jgi:hypothetical protein
LGFWEIILGDLGAIIVFERKTGVAELVCVVWVKWARKFWSKIGENA